MAAKLNTLLIFLLFETVYVRFTCPLNHESQTKCTSDDKRKTYTSCVLDYTVMYLWCDQTNFTRIPAPENIVSYAPPDRARKLFVNDSCIRVIRKGELNKYSTLEVFDCSHNLLTSLRNSLFNVSAPFLRNLHFQFNAIRSISKEAFLGLTDLKVLNLMNNELHALSDDAFYYLLQLRTLHLDSNKLHHLKRNPFDDIKRLEVLTLQSNFLRKWIHPSGRLTALKRLELDRNWISKIVKHNFHGMKSLVKLTLSHNRIQSIEEKSFDSNLALQHIDLSNNKLSHLPKHLFRHLCQLTTLMLNYNRLAIPHHQWFLTIAINADLPTSFIEVDITDNPWVCDTSSKDYMVFLSSLSKMKLLNFDQIGLFDLICTLPQAVAGSNIKNLTPTNVASQHRSEAVVSRNNKETSISRNEQEINNRSVVFFKKELRSLKEHCKMQLVSAVQTTSGVFIKNVDQLTAANKWQRSDEEMIGSRNTEPPPTVPEDSFIYLLVVLCSIAAMLLALIIILLGRFYFLQSNISK